MRYLVDTDWTIHYLNGRPDVVRRVDELRAAGVALSVASLAELYEGVYYSRDPEESERQVDAFLRGVAVLGIDFCIPQIPKKAGLRALGVLLRKFRRHSGESRNPVSRGIWTPAFAGVTSWGARLNPHRLFSSSQ